MHGAMTECYVPSLVTSTYWRIQVHRATTMPGSLLRPRSDVSAL